MRRHDINCCADREDRRVGGSQHFFGDRSEKQPLKTAAPMRAHDNEVGLLPVGLGKDLQVDVGCVDDLAGDWHADGLLDGEKALHLDRQLVAVAAGEHERLDSPWFEVRIDRRCLERRDVKCRDRCAHALGDGNRSVERMPREVREVNRTQNRVDANHHALRGPSLELVTIIARCKRRSRGRVLKTRDDCMPLVCGSGEVRRGGKYSPRQMPPAAASRRRPLATFVRLALAVPDVWR